MLKIRFVRIGKKNKPFFRIAVGDSRKTPKGKFIEKLGYYNPLKKEKSINKERVLHWISNGAQCSDTVHNLLVSLEIIKSPKRKIKIKSKKKGKGEEKFSKSEKVKESADDKITVDKNEKSEVKKEEVKEEVKEETKTEDAEKPAGDKVADEKKQEEKIND
jgi:small subunit ribosomal protein S16